MTAASYVCGVDNIPLIGETIGSAFDRIVAQQPDHEALVAPLQNVRWSYRELQEKAERLACGLLRLGLQPGDRIGIWSQNNVEWLLTQVATAKAGLILVTVNPAYRSSELEYALNKVGCKALILSPGFKASDYLAILASIAPELTDASPGAARSPALPSLQWVIRLGGERTAGMLNFDALLQASAQTERDELAAIGRRLQFDDPINIQFTSGTTGRPKGATLTHHNIVNNAFFSGQAMRLGPRDRLCVVAPLYHCLGMVLSSLNCIVHGSTMVLPGEGFDAESALRALSSERCTAINGVPTMFIAMLDHPRFAAFELSSMRTGIMAGSPCPIEVMRRTIQHMHLSEITIAYGMTETSPVSFQSSVTDSVERRVTTVGQVLPHVEVKIVDADGRIVPRGEKGEILTRGYCVMRGYWDDPAKTAEAIDSGRWMHTGDLGAIDEEGYCNILGRSKDMIIRGGENIYPREVEEFLYTHPKVLDVQCIGVPDAKYGEELCACVIVRPQQQCNAEEIRSFCKNRIAHYKVPRYVRFVDSFPLTVSGKVQKFVLREQISAELGLVEQSTA